MPTRVLIVEDNPVARSFLVRVVRESFSDELSIIETSDLETARRALHADEYGPAPIGSDPFGLVLCGLELADGSGLELLAQLTRYPAAKIATTLYSDDGHLFPALQCGADGYLFKEDRFEVLVEELQKIVRGQPTLSPAIARRLLRFFRDLHAPVSASGHSIDARPSEFGSVSRPMPLNAAYIGDDSSQITPRENEVLVCMSKGFTIKEIARLMGIRWFAVNDHLRAVCTKLALNSDSHEAILASQQAMS
ncbi:MAG: hypothetical protein RLY71_3555 [Pseudomonadota bacterium]|jgi:DNA-binding NarL/FixJ family response regulator